MPTSAEPPPDLHASLRAEVGQFRERERRRRFDPVVCVGSLGGPRSSVAVPAKEISLVDRQLRIELLSALLETAPAKNAYTWLCRPGPTIPTSVDIAWMTATYVAFAEAGFAVGGCYAITREGWVDLGTGETRVWKRLRLHR